MKEYRLKESTLNKDLVSRGFNIITAGPDTIAVKNVFMQTQNAAIIIYLKPPKRVVQWRFPSMAEIPLEPYIQDFIDLIDVDTPSITDFMKISDWSREVHQNAIKKGWWEKEPAFGDICSLMHTEISEAYEEYRKEGKMFYLAEDGKPEGIAVEFVDIVLRVFDYLEGKGIDIESVMKQKHEYNKTRPYKHGGKKV